MTLTPCGHIVAGAIISIAYVFTRMDSALLRHRAVCAATARLLLLNRTHQGVFLVKYEC